MKILLAEDERPLSHALSVLLSRNGYTVDVVDNGADALDYLTLGQYDAAVLDIMMPKMDGLTVLKTIRAKGNDLPVLMLTARSELDDRVLGLDCGADDYLSKPFEVKELLARLRAITRRNVGAVKDNKLTLGNTSLDRATMELSTPTGSVRLIHKEFQMMEWMLSSPGQIVSADQFLEKIWGWDSDAEQNVVWVYISNLRKKLSSLQSDCHIVARRYQGYTIEVGHD